MRFNIDRFAPGPHECSAADMIVTTMPRDDVDVEDPTPAGGIGEPAAHRWGRALARRTDTAPRMAGIAARSRPVKSTKPVANTVGTMAPPTKPWITRKTAPSTRCPRPCPHSALDRREEPRGEREQPARRQRLREEGGQRDHHELGHEIAGLDPADLLRRGRQARLHVVERRRATIWMSSSAMNWPKAITAEDQVLARLRQVSGVGRQRAGRRAGRCGALWALRPGRSPRSLPGASGPISARSAVFAFMGLNPGVRASHSMTDHHIKQARRPCATTPTTNRRLARRC